MGDRKGRELARVRTADKNKQVRTDKSEGRSFLRVGIEGRAQWTLAMYERVAEALDGWLVRRKGEDVEVVEESCVFAIDVRDLAGSPRGVVPSGVVWRGRGLVGDHAGHISVYSQIEVPVRRLEVESGPDPGRGELKLEGRRIEDGLGQTVFERHEDSIDNRYQSEHQQPYRRQHERPRCATHSARDS